MSFASPSAAWIGGPPPGRKAVALAAAFAAAASLSACAGAPRPVVSLASAAAGSSRPRAYNRPYQVRGRWYTPTAQPRYDAVGLASWYSYESPSRTTADGERFDTRLLTAAHTTLPIPSYLEVTNLANGRSIQVRLNDRGPFATGRILDVTRAAADQLGFAGQGVARVRVRYLGPAPGFPGGAIPQIASLAPPIADRTRASIPVSYTPVVAPAPALEVSRDARDFPPTSEADDTPPADMAAVDPPMLASARRPVRQLIGVFSVQAGAFADRRNADRAAARLGVTGDTQVMPLTRDAGGVLYRVIVGAWRDAQPADLARSRIVGMGFRDAAVVQR